MVQQFTSDRKIPTDTKREKLKTGGHREPETIVAHTVIHPCACTLMEVSQSPWLPKTIPIHTGIHPCAYIFMEVPQSQRFQKTTTVHTIVHPCA